MSTCIKSILIFSLLCNSQVGSAQIIPLLEIINSADQFINDYKDKQALDILESVKIENYANEDKAVIAQYFFEIGAAYDLNGDTQKSIKSFNKSCDYFEKAGIMTDLYLASLQSLGRLYYTLGDLDSSEKSYKKIVLNETPLFYSNMNDLVNIDYLYSAFYNLGIIFVDEDNVEMAKLCLSRIKQANNQSYDKMQGSLYKYIANHLSSKALNLREEEKYKEAIEAFDILIPFIEQNVGKKHLDYLQASSNKAIVLSFNLGLYKEAITLLNDIINNKKYFDEPNEAICYSYCSLVFSYASIGKFETTDTIILEGYEYLKMAGFDFFHPQMLYRFAGNCAYSDNNYSKAIDYYEKYLNDNNPREGAGNYEQTVNVLSVAYMLSGYPDKAQKMLESFLKDNVISLSTNNQSVLANIYHNMGRSLMLLGNNNRALAYLYKSRDLQIKIFGEPNALTTEYITECNNKK